MANNNKGVPVLNAPFSKEQEEALKRIQLAQMNANKLPTDWSQNVPTQNNPKQSTPVQSTPTQPINNVPKNNYTQNDAVGVGIKEPTRLTGFDRTNAINKYGSYENFGKYAPVQATLSSILSSPVVAAEGLIGTLVNGMNATSKKEIPEIERKQLEIQRQMREGAKSNINSNVGKGAYDIATGIGDMLTNTALAGGVGGGTALAGTLMGGQRANQVYQDAIDRGIDRTKATALATASGVAEGFFNTKGLDAIKSGITGNLLQKAIKGGAIEGAENILQTATEDIADALINGTDSELNAIKQNYLAQGMSEEEANKQTTIDVLKQYGMDFTTGAGFGAIMGTGREALGELPRLLKNTDNTRVDADNLNPLDMVADNERIVADAIARQNEAVDNINKLNEQLPEQTRSYRDLLSDNPYYDSDDFKAFSQERNSIIETRNKITDEIRDIDKQLDNYLEPNGLDKNTARALNLYSEEAQPLLARREALQQESNSLNDRFKELSDSLDNLRDNARANELANYSFDNNFRPLSQTEYDGFDINKGTNGEVQAALDSGKATLVEMTPEEYLRRVTYDIFNTSTMDSAIRGVESPDNIAKYAEAMRNGEKFPILNLTYDSKYGRGQEGRTRALAAYEAGIDKIPVAILGEPSENLNNRSLLDRINNARTQTDEMDIDELLDDLDIEDLIDDAEIDAPNEPSNVNTNSAYDDADWDRLLNGASEQPDLRLLDKPNSVAENTGTSTPTNTVPMPDDTMMRTGRGNTNILGEELKPAYPKTEAEMKAETIQRAIDENSYVPLKDDIRAIATENNFKPNSEADAKAYNDFMAQAEKYIDDMENAKSDDDFITAVGGLDALIRDAEGKIKGTTTYTASTGIEEARKQFADALIGHKIYLTQDVRDGKIPMREYNQAAYNAFGKSADGLKFVAKPTEGAVAFDQWLLENDNIKAIVGINADDGLSESLEKITNYLKSLKGKKNQTVTEDYDIAKAIYDSDIWDKVSDITNKRNVAPELANKGYSKTFTRTGTRNDLVNMADEVHKRASMYDKSSNRESLDIAVKRVSDDAEGWEQRLLSGQENIADETSVDTIMLLSKDLKSRQAEALANGDEVLARQLESRRIALMSKLREIGSKAGQKIQAFAKWNGTPEGLVLNAERLFDDNADKWSKTNKGKSDKIDKQSNFIANWWKTNFVEKAEGIVGFNQGADDDTLRQQIGELLSSMGGNKIDPANYEGTIDTFADMVREGMSGEQLAKRIKFYLANGITDISSDTVRQVEDIFNEASQLPINSKQRVELEQEAIKLLAYSKKTNATFAQKFDDWRFLAMLSKPSTHVRNIIGNTLFRTVTNISDNVAAVMESALGIENRTKAVLGVRDNGLVKASTLDADTNAARRLMGSKYSENIKGDIKRAQRVYNDDLIGRGLQKASDFNSNMLEMEDYSAMRKKYSTALASYLKANGLNESVFNLEKELNNNSRLLSNQEKEAVNTLAKARDYAIAQAEYSAFHEDNAVADILSQFSRQLNNSDSVGARAVGKIVEGIIPFKKTPANIVRSAVEYSPLNIFNDAVNIAKASKGNIDANEVIASMSKTITGSALTAMGAWLFDKGVLIAQDNDTASQDSLEGKQNYSLKIGGKTYTIDFLAPAVVPLLLGAEIKKVWDKNGSPNDSFWENLKSMGGDFDGMVNAAFEMGSPILETTMLGGLNDTLKAVGSAARNSENAGSELSAALMNAGTSYLQQGIPSSLGAIARTVDPYRRSTTTTADGEVSKALDKQIQKLENKIPGLSRTNEPFIDSRGRTQNNSPTNNPLINLAYQLASPTYVANVNETEADRIEREVYGATGNPDVFSTPEYSRKVGDSKLSPTEFARYKAVKGQEKTKLEEAVGQSDFFKGLSPEDQRETLKSIDGLSTKLGELYVRPDEVSLGTANEKLVNAYKKDGAEGVIKELNDSHIATTLRSQAKEIDGKTSNANLLSVLEKDTSKSDYDKGYALALAMSNPGKDAEKLISKGDYEGLYKKLSTENKYGVDLDNKKVSKIAADKGDAGLEILNTIKAKAKDDKGKVTVNNAIPVLNNMSMSDADKGYYLVNSSSYDLAKKAQAFANRGQYDKVWTYYQLKNIVDTNNNGRTDKKERAAAIPVLQKRGYSEAEAKQIVDWYK